MLRSASLPYELENSKKCYINIMVRSHMFSNFIRSCNLFICYPIHKETFLRLILYWYYIRRFCFVKLIFHATTNSTKFLITLSLAGDKFVLFVFYLHNYRPVLTTNNVSDSLITIREIDTYYRNYRKQCSLLSRRDSIVNYPISNSKSNAYITFQLPYKMFLQPRSKSHCVCTDNHLIRDHSITFIPSRSDSQR